METPLISVCIPVFNGENYIREAIDSVLAQTEQHFELVIADNCSTDRTREIAAGYSDRRIRVCKNEENVGLFGNLNKCIEYARGEYLVILPHDDLLLPSMLKVFSGRLNQYPNAGMVYSAYFQINSLSEKIKLCETQVADRVMSGEDAFNIFIRTCPIQCAMVRRKVYSDVGQFDLELKLSADVHMWCRIALAGYDVVFVKAPQNSVRGHEEQTTRHIYKQGEYGAQLFECYQKVLDSVSLRPDIQRLRVIAAKWPIKVQLIYIAKSLMHCDWKALAFHSEIFTQIINWAGKMKCIPSLTLVLLSLAVSIFPWMLRKLR